MINFGAEILALIPALNEEKTIGAVVQKTLVYSDYVIVVDDCSSDNTVEEAKKAGAIVISTTYKKRVGGVIRTGLEYIQAIKPHYVIFLDADGQHDPSYISTMIEILKNKDVDCVIGSRYLYNVSNKECSLGAWCFRQKEHILIKGMGNWFFSKIVSLLTRKDLTDVMSGFKAIKYSALEDLNLLFDYAYCPEMVIRLSSNGWNIKEIPIKYYDRKYGKSKVVNNIIEYGLKQLGIVLFTQISTHLALNVSYLREVLNARESIIPIQTVQENDLVPEAPLIISD